MGADSPLGAKPATSNAAHMPGHVSWWLWASEGTPTRRSGAALAGGDVLRMGHRIGSSASRASGAVLSGRLGGLPGEAGAFGVKGAWPGWRGPSSLSGGPASPTGHIHLGEPRDGGCPPDQQQADSCLEMGKP